MTRSERLLDGLGVADDALAPIRARLKKGGVPSEGEIELCFTMLRSAAATIQSALVLPIEAPRPVAKPEGADEERGPPGEDLWFRQGPME